MTPGSGLFCYSSHHHRSSPSDRLSVFLFVEFSKIFRDETGEWMSDREFEEDTEQCEKHETFCMEQTNDQ